MKSTTRAPRRVAPEPTPPALRAALLPLTAVLVFALAYVLLVPWPLALAAALPLVALFIFAPRWARASMRAFDRDLVSLLSTGSSGRAVERYARALGMRLFAAPAHRAERRARIAAAAGDAALARRLYARAFDGWESPKDVPVGIELGYAHACHASGHDADAVTAYRRVLAVRGALPLVRRNLAWSLARGDKERRLALEELDVAEKETADPRALGELTLVRALVHAKLGEKKRAKKLLATAEAIDGDVAEALRAEIAEC